MRTSAASPTIDKPLFYTLHTIERAALGGQSPSEICLLALQQLKDTFQVRRTSLALFNTQTGLAQVFAYDRENKTQLGHGQQIPLAAFAGLAQLRRGQIVIVPKINDLSSPSATDLIVAHEGIQAYISFPIIYSGRLLGCLNLANSKPYTYSEELERTGKEIASTLALALHNSQVIQETQENTKRLASLYDSSIRFGSVLDTNTLLEVINEFIHHQLNPDAVGIVLGPNHQNQVQVVLATENGKRIPEWEGKQLLLSDSGLTGWVIQNRRSLLIGDILTESLPVDPKHGKNPARSWLGVPLISRDRVIGAISVQSFTTNAFTASHQQFLESISVQAGISLENARLFEQTERRLNQLQGLRTIDQAITSSLDLHLVLRIFLEQVAHLLNIDTSTILLLNSKSHKLKVVAQYGLKPAMLRKSTLRLGDDYAGKAALGQKMILIQDLAKAPLDSSRANRLIQEGFISYAAVPLIAKNKVKGILEIINREPLEPDQEWLEFLETLATQAAIAIDNAMLVQNLQTSSQDLALAYDHTLEGWSRALELRDRETEGHAKRVTRMTVELAKLMGIRSENLGHIRRGALLHDIGKMGIPDSILLKPGPLNEEEWEIMRQHPNYAYELLLPIPFLRPALDIPRCHHERWDGSGYPLGLKAEQIPLPARIFAVIDIWDALSNDRPYRKALSQAEVLAYIRGHAGTLLDPQIVAAFMELIRRYQDNQGKLLFS